MSKFHRNFTKMANITEIGVDRTKINSMSVCIGERATFRAETSPIYLFPAVNTSTRGISRTFATGSISYLATASKIETGQF